MKVPKGTSDYQATWIINEDEKETDEESSDDDDDGNDLMDEAMDGEDEENHSQVSWPMTDLSCSSKCSFGFK